MTTNETVRRLLQYWLFIVLLPLATAGSYYFFARFQPKKFKSETTLYTGITSGYQIKGATSNADRDLEATRNAFDNLMQLVTSREVREEVCLRLLAWQLQEEAAHPGGRPAAGYPGASALNLLNRTLAAPKSSPYTHLLPPALKRRLVGATLEETTTRVQAYYQASNTNEVYRLLNSTDPSFSKDALSKIVVSRLKNSDMIQAEYVAQSPLLCQKTLELWTLVAIRKNRELFAGQGESVAGYFTQATRQAQARLQAAEERLQAFEQQHNVVDYERQLSVLMNERQATATDYINLEMAYAGSVAALRTLEATLATQGVRNLQSQEIMDMRNQLADLNDQAGELALLLKNQPDAIGAARLSRLRQEAAQVGGQIGERVQRYAQAAPLGQGLVTKNLLVTYTKTALRAEELRSRLGLMRQQKDLAARRYDQLVPLGVELAHIRREVEVAEKAYASQAEGLKKSKLLQQNSTMASQLRVVDPPNLPSVPTDDKTLVLLLASLVAMLLLVGAAVATTGVLDQSLLDPAQAAKATSFAVAGVVPELADNEAYDLARRAEDHLARQLLLQFYGHPRASQPYLIGVLSSRRGEGKTGVACNLAASLNEMGIRTVNLFPDDHKYQLIPNDDTAFYLPLQGLRPGVTAAELAARELYPDEVVIIEFPAVCEAAYPASLLRSLNLILVAVRAERSWQAADRAIFDHIQHATDAPIELVLNGVMPEYVMEIIGARGRPARVPHAPALPLHPLPDEVA
jgi:uncharacterized protein involved in exopolysaccharide biosynthesis